MPNPDDFIPEFIGQRDNEVVEIILFKHWYFVAVPIVKALSILVLTFVIPFWLKIIPWIFSYGLTTAVYYLWMVFWVGYMVYQYLSWYRDRFIVTNQRIVDIDQRGMFNRQVSECELDKIQNLTHSVKGVFATMLNFGTIIVQSSGAHDLSLNHIADPAGVQEEITKLIKLTTSQKPILASDLIDFIKKEKL